MFAISPTDINWFQNLREKGLNIDVNFWTPTPWNVSKPRSGDKLYFMLKSPIRKIGGYGHFVKYENQTPTEAWNQFGLRNGCANYEEFVSKLAHYKALNSKDDSGPSQIGCIVLTDVNFFDDDEFLDVDDFGVSFPRQVVKIKYFEQNDPFGNSSVSLPTTDIGFDLVKEEREEYRSSSLQNQRKGQGKFRSAVSRAYSDRCCISMESTPELLEAAHIQPYRNVSSNHVQNGLLLRVDLHKLYDSGLLYVDEQYKIHVSPIVKSESYRQFHGRRISLPEDLLNYPSKQALKSRKNQFRK